MVALAGASPTEALAMASTTPADAIGLRNRGRLALGQRADLVLWSGDLHVQSAIDELHDGASMPFVQGGRQHDVDGPGNVGDGIAAEAHAADVAVVTKRIAGRDGCVPR